ncbi:integrase, partial [Pseudomonas syringae pv. tagetis]|uniref:phage integrase central domain-containing protein n=1 Tax=Pseudomonas syringae group genomosp. 7 TaxID=251699 RepID=UPI00376F5CC5
KQARKKADRDTAGETFEPLAREWYASRLNNWDAGTAKRIIGALDRHVFPVYGRRQFANITSHEWMDFIRGMEQKLIIEK